MDTPRPSPRTNRTRRVPHPVLIGHAASLIAACVGVQGFDPGRRMIMKLAQDPSSPVLRLMRECEKGGVSAKAHAAAALGNLCTNEHTANRVLNCGGDHSVKVLSRSFSHILLIAVIKRMLFSRCWSWWRASTRRRTSPSAHSSPTAG